MEEPQQCELWHAHTEQTHSLALVSLGVLKVHSLIISDIALALRDDIDSIKKIK